MIKKNKIICWGVFLVIVNSLIVYLNIVYQAIAFHPFNGTGQYNLCVLTWNIHSTGENFDAEKTVELIISENADVVGVNEYNDSTAHKLDSLLLRHYPYTEGERKGKCQDLIYSRFPIIDYKAVKEKRFHPLIHSCILDVKGRDVRLYLCHLASNNKDSVNIEQTTEENSEDGWKRYWHEYNRMQEQRIKEINLMVLQLDTLPQSPTIIMGDMNDFSCSRIFEPLYSREFCDAWWENGYGYGETYKYKFLRLRIDHMFYNKVVQPIGIKVVDSKDMSDHNAIVAKFKMRNK